MEETKPDLKYAIDGKFWLWAFGTYVGYYPASLFLRNGSKFNTLAEHSTRINFYGEVYNSEDYLTTTDMGSGEFSEAGEGSSAYIRNIVYWDLNGVAQHHKPNASRPLSDPERYRYIGDWSGNSKYGSNMYLGGPGAGGKIGA